MSSILQQHLAKRGGGTSASICSVYSAHPWVIRAAAEQAAESNSLLLIEATSNQVNQFGGYTGMRPAEFRNFVLEHVAAAGLTKIHLDASMSCAGDPVQLSDEDVARRAVQLCKAAEAVRTYGDAPIYVIGTEVPVPGGPTRNVDDQSWHGGAKPVTIDEAKVRGCVTMEGADVTHAYAYAGTFKSACRLRVLHQSRISKSSPSPLPEP